MTKIKIAVMLSLLALPSLVFGAGTPPSNVQNVRASNANGIVTVTWQAATDDTGVDTYRVYYSRNSILDNSGNYDDFVQTQGAETAYSFTSVPVQGDKLYVSVLAVDTDGNESEGFETEASVALPVTQEEVAAEPAVAVADTTAIVTYAGVTPMSATGLLLSFSKDLDTSAGLTPANFLIEDASGAVLQIEKVEMGGANILITTEAQVPQKLYIVTVVKSLRAVDGSVFPNTTPRVQFLGFGEAPLVAVSEPTEEPLPVEPVRQVYLKNPILSAVVAPSSPLSVRLVPMQQQDGTFSVLAQWSGGSATVIGYEVSVSTDGVNFGATETVDSTQTSMEFTGIAPGDTFAVRVLEKTQGSMIASEGYSDVSLPQSGAGILGILGASGVLAFRRRMKKRQKAC